MKRWIKESSALDSKEVKMKKAEENAKIAIAKYNNMPRVVFIASCGIVVSLMIIGFIIISVVCLN